MTTIVTLCPAEQANPSDTWLARALARRAAEGDADPQSAVAAFNSSL